MTFLFAALSGCAPVMETVYVPLQDELFANINFDRGQVVIQYTQNEPEVVLEEELKELDKIGGWEETASQKQVQAASEPEEVTYDFPITMNKQVEFYLNLFQTKQRSYFERWLARSTKYLPYIKAQLKEAGLPQDLAYLAMIESGYNPSAYSKSHAAGLWQFISSTGKNYGLRIDSWVDERREPEKATLAAIDYLTFLYKEFGSWYLAVAAYNAGEGKIGRGVKKYNTDDFWVLASKNYLALETKRYVPKLIAAILIAKEPEKYGFTNIEYQEPAKYDVVQVPPMTDLNAVATAGRQDIKTIRALNNELLKDYTPPGDSGYDMKIPRGSYKLVAANLKRLHPVVSTDYKTHVVKRGDTLTAISKKYNISKTTLLKANNLHSAKLLAGQRLRIPYQATKYVLLKEGETAASRFASAESGGELFLHEVKKGETLSKIARQYNVEPEIIMQWNNLPSVHKISAGQHLALYLEHGNQPVQIAAADQFSLPTLPPSAKKRAPAAAKAKEAVTYYRVKNGDTLWSIAQKFKVSLNQIKQWNKLKSNLIHPGVQLVIRKA
ncbi:MAG: LysM peptidoglycan-binding domain-containing protein [Desulfobulbaceae bacterium]|nr:LysM peptidoglycan-binding domain-containing protein [Desulfobulbaceae bacterium]MDY0351994.1 LysM peptidoglycan-binding domain-containing protein [Desulfobulbaceae bacterium]